MPWLERAVALADETLGIDHPSASQARFDLLMARWELGRRDDACALAREILPRLRARGAEGQQLAGFVESWLAEHR